MVQSGLWRALVSLAFAVVVAVAGVFTPSTPAHAQTVGARGVQVLGIDILRGGYSNTQSHLQAAYEGSQWAFYGDGTFAFTPSPNRGARRTGSYRQSGSTIEFE